MDTFLLLLRNIRNILMTALSPGVSLKEHAVLKIGGLRSSAFPTPKNSYDAVKVLFWHNLPYLS
jgi:hypothetical protein